MKKFISIILVFSIICVSAMLAIITPSLAPNISFALHGEGTEDKPYIINNQTELSMLRSHSFEGEFVRLNNNIVIGGYFGQISGFRGTFDGGNHTISNISRITTSTNQGFFASLYSPAVIKNLHFQNYHMSAGGTSGLLTSNCFDATFINVSVTDSSLTASAGNVGVFWGYGRGTIIDCAVENVEINGVSSNTGGFIGQGTGDGDGIRIENSYFIGTIKGRNNVGGLAGQMGSVGTISNSFSGGEIIANGSVTTMNSGGLVGDFQGTRIENCYTTMKITANSTSATGVVRVGGIYGNSTRSGVVVQNCAILGSELTATRTNTAVNMASFVIGNNSSSATNISTISNNIARNDIQKSVTDGITPYNYDTVSETFESTEFYTNTMEIFKNRLEWNFEDIWSIQSDKNSGLPLPIIIEIMTPYTKLPVANLIEWYKTNKDLFTEESFSVFKPYLTAGEDFVMDIMAATREQVQNEFDIIQNAAEELLVYRVLQSNTDAKPIYQNLLFLITVGLFICCVLISLLKYATKVKK